MTGHVISDITTRSRRQHVSVGDVLITSLPFAFVLKSSLLGCCCSYCLERCTSLMQCSGCKLLRFCGSQCHKSAWKEFHKFECKKMALVNDRIIPDSALLLARIINKLNSGGDCLSECVDGVRRRYFKNLMSHYTDLKADTQRVQHVQSLLVVLRRLLPAGRQLPNSAELMGIYGRMCINCFNVLDGEMNPIGVAVYLAPSIVDHSCAPNAVATFSGRSLQIRAVEPIDNFSWSKVRISYIDMLADRDTRRRQLTAGYFFTCHCSRCTSRHFLDKERTVACGNDECTEAIVVPCRAERADHAGRVALTCHVCGHVTTMTSLECDHFDEVISMSQKLIQEALDSTLYYESCSVCLERQRECRFHSLNLFAVKIRDLTFETAVGAQMWQQALDMGQTLLAGYRLYYGQLHPLYGLLLLKLAKMALYMLRHKMAAGWLAEAARVLRVTHGAQHRLLSVELRSLCAQLSVEAGSSCKQLSS